MRAKPPPLASGPSVVVGVAVGLALQSRRMRTGAPHRNVQNPACPTSGPTQRHKADIDAALAHSNAQTFTAEFEDWHSQTPRP